MSRQLYLPDTAILVTRFMTPDGVGEVYARKPHKVDVAEHGGVVLESMGGPPRRVTPEEAQQLQDDTARFWRSWLHRSTYTGRWREMVNRSAMTLKAFSHLSLISAAINLNHQPDHGPGTI